MILHASVVARVVFVAVVEDILLPLLSLSSSAAARQTFGVCLFFAHSLLAPPQKRNSSCLRSDAVVDEKIWTSTTVTSLLLSFVVGCCAYFRGAKEKTR